MLTISQLAAHAGVTVRAVRHYHAKGLLPEPDRDASGYRRYDAAAVVELIRIRTLADAGVPLSRVHDLLGAGPQEFAEAVAAIDRRLRAEIGALQRHRRRMAQLVAGDSLALPPEAVAYFDRVRELGLDERLIEIERDSWIMISAQVPDQVPALMAIKTQQIENDDVRRLYRDLVEASDYAPDDVRLADVADRVSGFLEVASAAAEGAGERAGERAGGGSDEVEALSDELVDLLDSAFVASFPAAARLLELLEERGWVGWTMIERAPGADVSARLPVQDRSPEVPSAGQ